MAERVNRQSSEDSVAEGTTLENASTEHTNTIQPRHRHGPHERDFSQDRGYRRDWPSLLLVGFLVVGLMLFGCLTFIMIATRPSTGSYVSRPMDNGHEPGEQQPYVGCRPCGHGETMSADANCCQTDVNSNVPTSIRKVHTTFFFCR